MPIKNRESITNLTNDLVKKIGEQRKKRHPQEGITAPEIQVKKEKLKKDILGIFKQIESNNQKSKYFPYIFKLEKLYGENDQEQEILNGIKIRVSPERNILHIDILKAIKFINAAYADDYWGGILSAGAFVDFLRPEEYDKGAKNLKDDIKKQLKESGNYLEWQNYTIEFEMP